jgi:tetratricopeptide (TPR) repeat protein
LVALYDAARQVAAAASLAALPPPQVRPLLRQLVDAHIVDEHRSGRYTFHDLLRAYAAEQVHDDERDAATQRMLEHYLHTANRAEDLLTPTRERISLAPAQPGVTVEWLDDRTQALDWFIAERPVLLAAVEFAAATGRDQYAWQLAWTLTVFLDSRGFWHDWVASQSSAVAAARRLADPLAQARAHRVLGVAYLRLSRYHDAYEQLQSALDAYRQAGDDAGLAHTHVNLGGLMGRQNNYAEVLAHAQEALRLYRSVDDRTGIADSLNGVGWAYAHLEDYEPALTYTQQALEQFQQIKAPYREADVWTNLGYIHTCLHHREEAVTCYQQAIELFRQQGDRYFEAKVLTDLGDSHRAFDDSDSAATAWRQALVILTELHHADADKVRAKLRETPRG